MFDQAIMNRERDFRDGAQNRERVPENRSERSRSPEIEELARTLSLEARRHAEERGSREPERGLRRLRSNLAARRQELERLQAQPSDHAGTSQLPSAASEGPLPAAERVATPLERPPATRDPEARGAERSRGISRSSRGGSEEHAAPPAVPPPSRRLPTAGELMVAVLREMETPQAVTALGINRRQYLASLLEHPPGYIWGFYERDPTGGTLVDVLRNPQAAAVCYVTAERLMDLLGQGNPLGTGTTSEGRVSDRVAVLQATMASLVNSFGSNRAAEGDFIYKVKLAAHGFTFLLRWDGTRRVVEQLESFAGGGEFGQTLLQSALERKRYDVDAVIAALNGVVASDEGRRNAAARAIGFNAPGICLDEAHFPAATLEWECRRLRPDLEAAIRTRIRGSATAITRTLEDRHP